MAEPAFSGERVERRLAAILAADVVGYSRLMGEDEAGTLRRLKIHRLELIDPLIAQHKGRIVKLMGDGALVEFGSVVEAVACAVAIQRGMAERETELPESQKIRFRIGVNTGDVIIEGDDIYGDGVNIAARLEGLAEPGGICIAENVYQQVKGKLPAGFTSLGAQKVKNIAEPVQAFKVDLGGTFKAVPVAAQRSPVPLALAAGVGVVLLAGAGWWWQSRTPPPPVVAVAPAAPATETKPALPLPDRPSIAVLPFDNLSGEERLGRLADGMVDDIITDLSRFRDLFVIARNSTFRYRGKHTDVREIGRELGVKYVMEGSIQQNGDRVRLTAQLIDATNGGHVWSERYDKPLEELLVIRDEVTGRIAAALASGGAVITQAEWDALRARSPTTLQAYELVQLGIQEYLAFNKEANDRAREYFERAIELSPDFQFAWQRLAWAREQHVQWAPDRSAARKSFYETCNKTLQLDPRDASAHFCVGLFLNYSGDFDGARRKYKDAIGLNPNQANNLAGISGNIAWLGEPDLGVELIETALRLNPFPTPYYYQNGSNAYFWARKFEKCVEMRLMLNRPTIAEDPRTLARCYGMMGRVEDANEYAARAMQIQPEWSLESERGRPGAAPPPPGKNEDNLSLEATRKAGLPVCATEAQLVEFRAKWPDFKTMPECDAERAKVKG